MVGSLRSADELSEEREQARPAFAAVPGPHGDHFHLEGSGDPGVPALAHRIALQQAQQAEAIVAVLIETCRTAAWPLRYRQ